MMVREEYLPESRACVARQSAIGVSVRAAHSIGLLWQVPAGRSRNPSRPVRSLNSLQHIKKNS